MECHRPDYSGIRIPSGIVVPPDALVIHQQGTGSWEELVRWDFVPGTGAAVVAVVILVAAAAAAVAALAAGGSRLWTCCLDRRSGLVDIRQVCSSTRRTHYEECPDYKDLVLGSNRPCYRALWKINMKLNDGWTDWFGWMEGWEVCCMERWMNG